MALVYPATEVTVQFKAVPPEGVLPPEGPYTMAVEMPDGGHVTFARVVEALESFCERWELTRVYSIEIFFVDEADDEDDDDLGA